MRPRLLLPGPLLAVVGLLALFLRASGAPTAGVSGVVVDASGAPLGGATVRIQATTNSTTSAADGAFTLVGLPQGVPVTVSAWKEGCYCAKAEAVVPPASGTTLTLRPYQTDDNPGYAWVPPAGPPAGENSCFSCKQELTRTWLDNDAHARSGANARFLSLYNGSDIAGTAVISPGFKLDFPGTAGNCATCHAPGAAVDAPFSTDMNRLAGVDRDYGVHCDFCHKVADIYLNPATGRPYDNAPGVISLDVRRPFPESERYQLFFGTFDDDNVPAEDTYLPLIQKSQWCAPCHQFSFWGTPIYQSFREWQESAYPARGVECQACHMPPDGVMTNVAPGFGGVERDPQTIHAHTMPGAASQALLQDTLALTLTVRQVGNALLVSTDLFNYGAGHHVPTDHPGRHLILTVAAADERGNSLTLLSGPAVPAWGGVQAGLPGKLYAKILQDVASGGYPVVSYWKRTRIVSDNRIPAFGRDRAEFIFAAGPAGSRVTVTAKMRFRRLFAAEAAARNWEQPDILMESAALDVTIAGPRRIYFPLIDR